MNEGGRSIQNDHSTNHNNHNNDNSINHNNDNSTNIHNSSITVNLFGQENIGYIHIPNYLTDKSDIVKLVTDVHFHKDHPENHNVVMGKDNAIIYRKLFRKNKILWEKYSPREALSELIQNGETILTSYKEPLSTPQEGVRDVIKGIVEKETSWNCLTERLSQFLKEQECLFSSS